MMEVSSGVVRISKGSKEEKEFNLLYASIIGIPDESLVAYHNELIKLGYLRTGVQDMMITVIAYARKQIVREYF